VEVRYNKKFLKELSDLPDVTRKKVEDFVFHQIKSCPTLKDVPKIRKISGYKNYYRIRFGQYRAGLSFKNNIIVFERILHRKDIYKYFP
jgi:mRNA interferase RelE/StbE